VRDFEEAETAAVEVARARERLVLEAGLGGEEAFVEQFGGEARELRR
jgi:hypothetical protein